MIEVPSIFAQKAEVPEQDANGLSRLARPTQKRLQMPDMFAA